MTTATMDLLRRYLRLDDRAIAGQHPEVTWCCRSWTRTCSGGDSGPAGVLCAGCVARAECLIRAVVLYDPASWRGGLTSADRAAVAMLLEYDQIGLNGWLNERRVVSRAMT